MSRECIQNCPNILDCLDSADSARTTSAISHFPVGGDTLDDLMEWCAASYDCPGPELTEVEVVKGIFRKRTVVENYYVCQFPEQS